MRLWQFVCFNCNTKRHIRWELSEGYFLFGAFFTQGTFLYPCCSEPKPAADRGAEPAGHEQEDLRLHPPQLPRLTHRQEHQAGGGIPSS
jgi:hypothetical protein